MKRGAFLDRDGVINRSLLVDGVPKPPKNIDEVEILEGVIEAIGLLKGHDFVPVVITNQPDVARGILSIEELERINKHIGSMTGIEFFYVCPHDDLDKCDCRKPAPGLIFKASYELGLEAKRSFLVGDRWRDIHAGQSAGCKCLFIDYSYSEMLPKKPFTTVSSLLHAVKIVTGELSGT